jgi:hypothetical protein
VIRNFSVRTSRLAVSGYAFEAPVHVPDPKKTAMSFILRYDTFGVFVPNPVRPQIAHVLVIEPGWAKGYADPGKFNQSWPSWASRNVAQGTIHVT